MIKHAKRGQITSESCETNSVPYAASLFPFKNIVDITLRRTNQFRVPSANYHTIAPRLQRRSVEGERENAAAGGVLLMRAGEQTENGL